MIKRHLIKNFSKMHFYPLNHKKSIASWVKMFDPIGHFGPVFNLRVFSVNRIFWNEFSEIALQRFLYLVSIHSKWTNTKIGIIAKFFVAILPFISGCTRLQCLKWRIWRLLWWQKWLDSPKYQHNLCSKRNKRFQRRRKSSRYRVKVDLSRFLVWIK